MYRARDQTETLGLGLGWSRSVSVSVGLGRLGRLGRLGLGQSRRDSRSVSVSFIVSIILIQTQSLLLSGR